MDPRSKTTAPSQPLDRCPVPSPPSDNSRHSKRNVFGMIARREISPRTKHIPRRNWGEAFKRKAGPSSGSQSETTRDPKRALLSWVEAESLRHLSAKYCPLLPPPRSTIAAAFSPDGRTLASTHGDHTVKIIDCQTGSCLNVLTGHRRTPWVVRFHPLCPEILASGSLDQEVHLWDANTSECIGSCDFYRPIASIAFHAKGEFLAVASGHKLYIWNYSKKTAPAIVLKTRRSLRAVHFHPHAAPFLLTAEVNDLDSSDSSMTQATSLGYLRYPPPAVFVANFHSSDRLSFAAELAPMSLPLFSTPSFSNEDSRIERQLSIQNAGSSGSVNFQTDANAAEQYHNAVPPMETSPSVPPGSHPGLTDGSFHSNPISDAMEADEMQPVGRTHNRNFTNLDALTVSSVRGSEHNQNRLELAELGQLHRILPGGDYAYWEQPFLQGWLMGQSQAGLPSMLSLNGSNREHSAQATGSILTSHIESHNLDAMVASLAMPGSTSLSGVSGRSAIQQRFANLHFSVPESAHGPTPVTLREGGDAQPIISRIQSELVTSLAAAAAAELPCTVKLRVWSHDITNPSATLSAERCRLTIPHAVLCSEMGAHFSPCGRFLAACVACTLPQTEADSGLQTLVHQDPGAATSPTRHPISAHQVMYELRIYSLEEATFGSVLVSRAIRAAHCLTSIQFSPTSEHILLAYGRRHGSLLKSIVIDGETTLPIYTVLEVYRVSDMELVRVLPSAEDEVNVACFHPFAGGGLVYGTKEGKLRVLQYDSAYGEHCTREN
ncbi:Activating molecule in BECN1-regulated autophagy protein 1 [Morus notabilis]|uniref:Activating molecule in BECN1-regulated autophagy protein 1 n=1 Tax=Morus notabilis TaxID=981085 RepID=W9QPD3_9ROSA|nr:Activating molecule in BECN1-regulated autophagy protein 1 [Morus notabilis]